MQCSLAHMVTMEESGRTYTPIGSVTAAKRSGEYRKLSSRILLHCLQNACGYSIFLAFLVNSATSGNSATNSVPLNVINVSAPQSTHYRRSDWQVNLYESFRVQNAAPSPKIGGPVRLNTSNMSAVGPVCII